MVFVSPFQQIGSVGINAIVTDAIMLISTFFITCWLGRKWLKIDKEIVQPVPVFVGSGGDGGRTCRQSAVA